MDHYLIFSLHLGKNGNEESYIFNIEVYLKVKLEIRLCNYTDIFCKR